MSLRRLASDAGASAVEFAIVTPLLFVLVFGIIDFGWAYFRKISLNAAVREGVRELALHDDAAAARTRADTTFGESGVAYSGISGCPSGTPGDATITATYDHTYITPLPALVGFGTSVTLDSTGVMRCGG